MAPLSRLLFFAMAFPFVFATSSASSSSDCDEGQFFYADRKCCLPEGGVSNPPPPPQNTQCPSSGDWYWHEEQVCCVPSNPPPPNPSPPQCNDGWAWHMPSSCCQPSSSPTPTATSQPSGRANHARRTQKSRRTTLCPNDMTACPLPGLSGSSNDFECITPESDIESCGGCVSTGAGIDCTALEGVWNVGCEQGACSVYTCQDGYTRSIDGASCLKL